MQSDVIEITPQMASQWLATSRTKNRFESATIVKRFAADMAGGKWQLNGESIVFDTTGSILNGHHRLRACVLAGVCFKSLVVNGVPPEHFACFDTGRARNSADVLDIAGESNARALASLARAVHFWELGCDVTAFGKQSFTGEMAIEVVARHEGLRQCVTWAKTASNKYRPINGTLFGWAKYVLPFMDESGEDFVEKLATGVNLESDSPILALRRWFDNRAMSAMHSKQFDKMAALVYAWNHYYFGRKVTHIKTGPLSKFPAIAPNSKENPILI